MDVFKVRWQIVAKARVHNISEVFEILDKIKSLRDVFTDKKLLHQFDIFSNFLQLLLANIPPC